MKKILSYAILLAGIATLAISCSNDALESNFLNYEEGQGAATFSLNVSDTRAEAEYPWNFCAIRIFKYSTDEGGESKLELIRRYNSREEMPEAMWLVAGKYNIDVELGNKSAEATFTEKCYHGSTDFTITEGVTSPVTVDCRIQNTIVEVVFDQTIAATFTGGYNVTAAIDDTYDEAAVASGEVLSLNYTTSKQGYFRLSEDMTSLSWRFYGLGTKDGEEIEVDKSGSRSISPEPGMRYVLTYKYSKDLGGHLSVDFTVKVDENTDDINNDIMFVPDPQITGDGFTLSQTQKYVSGEKRYIITSIGNLESITIVAGDKQVTIPATASYNDSASGIALTYNSATDVVLTLSDNFFSTLAAGEQIVTITALDVDGGEGVKESPYMVQGAYSLHSTDKWNAKGELKAYVFDSAASSVKILYRAVGTEPWSEATATSVGNDTYSASGSGINANTTYEYQLVINSANVGIPAVTTIGNGASVFNGGLELWSGDCPLLPYTSSSNQLWDTGNHGSATLDTNITTNESDVRPGSSGKYSAKLQSKYVALLGMGKFAAGNIFMGQYLGTAGMDGVIGFGKPFTFDYRPKQLTFWYKGNVGSVDYAGGGLNKGDSDVAKAYICLCHMGGPRVVRTDDKSSFFDPSQPTTSYCSSPNGKNSNNDKNDGKIVAYGQWSRTNSEPQLSSWTKITIDLVYHDVNEGVVPNYMIISFASSGYGDYFAGSTSSVMYIDDVELVY